MEQEVKVSLALEDLGECTDENDPSPEIGSLGRMSVS